MINSYPSVFAIGHRAIADIFSSPVIVEEKVDGSQFSWSRQNGELFCRSKGQQLVLSAPEKMFATAVNVAGSLDVIDGWIYRAEYLQSAKHNTLTYGRVPQNHLALFDVQVGIEQYLTPEDRQAEAARIGIDCVPVIHNGDIKTADDLLSLLDRESFLGGVTIEGVVVKNHAVFTHEKKVAMGKLVREGFREKNASNWKANNPTKTDVVQALIAEFKTEARWRKAIQHLRDAGKIEGSPRDIGKLIVEIPDDIRSDSEDDIKERLFAHFWPHIRRGVTAGFPDFYKRELAATAFSDSK